MSMKVYKRRSLERWKEMSGAVVEYEGQQISVRTQEHAKLFFQEILSRYNARDVVSRPSDHAWLSWLIASHYNLDSVCPAGPRYFTVHANKDIGHSGNDKGFSVVGNGAEGSVPFAYMRALRGVPKSDREKLSQALKRGVDYLLQHWLDVSFQPGSRCPVTNVVLIRGVNLYVERDPPQDVLEQSFFNGLQLDPEQVVVDEFDRGSHFNWQLADAQLLEAWRKHHWNNVRLCAVSIVGHHKLLQQRLDFERSLASARLAFSGIRTPSEAP